MEPYFKEQQTQPRELKSEADVQQGKTPYLFPKSKTWHQNMSTCNDKTPMMPKSKVHCYKPMQHSKPRRDEDASQEVTPSYNHKPPGKLTMSNIDTTLIRKPSKIETNHGELSMTETLPDVIHLKPDVHRPMSRLYDRPRLQHTHVPPVSPVLNTYSDIEASLRRRTHTYSDVTTSLKNTFYSPAKRT